MRVIVVATLALAAFAAWVEPARAQNAGESVQSRSEPAGAGPSLALPDLSGAEQSLATYKGRVVVLTFWATSCLPCRQEAAGFAALQSEFAPWGVEVVGVSTDSAADRAEVVNFVREHKVNYPVWVGATAADLERFGVGPVPPATVVLDAGGRVVARFGAVSVREVRKRIEGLIAQRREAGGELARAEPAEGKEGAARVPS